MTEKKPFTLEEKEKYLDVILSDEEALIIAQRIGFDNFSLNMDKTQKVRVKVSSLCCPVCQSKNISIAPIKIRRFEDNDNHRMVCNSCEVTTTLWHVVLADHYVI